KPSSSRPCLMARTMGLWSSTRRTYMVSPLSQVRRTRLACVHLSDPADEHREDKATVTRARTPANFPSFLKRPRPADGDRRRTVFLPPPLRPFRRKALRREPLRRKLPPFKG